MGIKIKDFEKKLEQAFKKGLDIAVSDRFLNQIGASTVRIIRKRTKLGFGVRKNNGSKFKLLKLSDSYVAQRRNKLGFWTNANGIVVPITTLTGKELKAFRASKSARKQVTKNRAFLKQHNPKLSSDTSPKKSNLTQTGNMLDEGLGHIVLDNKIHIGMMDGENAKKAAFVSKKRPFLNLSKAEINQITKIIRTRIQAIFKQLLK